MDSVSSVHRDIVPDIVRSLHTTGQCLLCTTGHVLLFSEDLQPTTLSLRAITRPSDDEKQMPDAYASQGRKRCQKMSETFVAKLVYTVVCLVLSDVSPLSGRRVVVNASIFSVVLWPRHDDASEREKKSGVL